MPTSSLEEAADDLERAQTDVEPAPGPAAVPLLISGRDEDALRRQAARWAEWLRYHLDVRARDVAHTAAIKRVAFEARAAVVGRTAAELAHGLEALAAGHEHPTSFKGRPAGGAASSSCFLVKGASGAPWGRPCSGESGL